MYTFALWFKRACMPWKSKSVCGLRQLDRDRRLTFTVSLPIPVFPPVTSMTLPDRSGISSVLHVGLGGNMLVQVLDIVLENRCGGC